MLVSRQLPLPPLTYLQWEDSRLKWAPSNYENVSKVHIRPELLWRPDIMVGILLGLGFTVILWPPRCTTVWSTLTTR